MWKVITDDKWEKLEKDLSQLERLVELQKLESAALSNGLSQTFANFEQRLKVLESRTTQPGNCDGLLPRIEAVERRLSDLHSHLFTTTPTGKPKLTEAGKTLLYERRRRP